MDKNVFNKVSYGVYIATSKFNDSFSGCVITTLMQITAEDTPKMSIAVNKDNFTNELIRNSGMVNISILSTDADMLLIGKYGFRSGRDFDKFNEEETIILDNGIPCVTKNVIGYFKTKVINEVDAGTHTIFLLEAEDAIWLNDKATPMTYDYYHKVVKGKTPKNAATFSN